MRIFYFLAVFIVVSLYHPYYVSAHAFGQLYNLPVPFWLYLYGGAASLILSFLLIGYFVGRKKSKKLYPVIFVPQISFFTHSWFIKSIKTISVFLFLLTIVTGLLGEDIASINFNMTFFWIIFILGFTYFIGFFGNCWYILNPFSIISDFFGNILQKGIIRYPEKLGYLPALCFYFLFIWVELFGQTTPFFLSLLLALYTILTLNAVLLFGKKAWFDYGEFFSVYFYLLGMMGIFEERNKKFFLRPPFAGLLKEKPVHINILLFILFMLSSTAFDGFRSTTLWIDFYTKFVDGYLTIFLGVHRYLIFETVALLFSPVLFLLVYILMLLLAKKITRTNLKLRDLLLHFAFSLIPIAFAYNIAHYFTLLITEGFNIIRLISDPFGYGWNIFGTRGEFFEYIPDANIIWHSQVGIILLGHIAAVYIAHRIALNIFPTHKKAILSQIPMLFLMVIYTMIGLWILSQPITAEL